MGRPTKSNSTNWYKDYTEKALSKIEAVLSALKIDYTMRLDNIVDIACPVHGSDDVGHSIIYLNSGTWICFSGNCHADYGKSVLGLIKGTLDKSGAPCSWDDVKKVIDTNCAGPITKVVNTYTAPDLFKDEASMPETIIPSKYFLARGYSEKSLREFGVGDAVKGVWANRAIVPVRYVNGEYMGFSARIHWPECKSCGYHHSKYETCLSKDHDFHFMYNKWYHSKGLQKSRTLYGIDKIPNGTKKVAIIEGPGDVWKLYDYGIPAVACMGKDFSRLRLELLQNKGVERVLFIGDKDEAGEEFKTRFINDYHKDINIFLPHLTSKDPSEMKDEDIKKYIVGKWDKI